MTCDYTGWKIRAGFLDGNLFYGQVVEGIDEEASAARYTEMLEEDLQRAFPGAEIRVVQDSGSGSLPYPCHTRAYAPNGFSEDRLDEELAVEKEVVAVSNCLWASGAWLVKREGGEHDD